MTKTALYLEHFELERAPFIQEPDPNVFFQGGGHKLVLKALQEDILAGKPLIKLTGSEGVGKTLVNLMLTRVLPADVFDIISLDHPVGSFEDLLRVVCVALNRGAEDNAAPQEYVREFRQILRGTGRRDRKVLLIIDEAEKIFLATLERLVKLICETEEESVLQVVLIGRLDLDYNLDQLRTYCANVDIHAGYILEPLNLEETGEYLQYRLRKAGITGKKYLSVFSDEAVAALYRKAMGNISMTNILAENSMKEACARGMFNVEPELDALRPLEQEGDYSKFARGVELIMQNRWWAGGGALLVVLFLSMLFGGRDQEVVRSSDTPGKVIIKEAIIEKPEIRLQESPPPSVKKQKENDEPPEAVIEKPATGTTQGSDEPVRRKEKMADKSSGSGSPPPGQPVKKKTEDDPAVAEKTAGQQEPVRTKEPEIKIASEKESVRATEPEIEIVPEKEPVRVKAVGKKVVPEKETVQVGEPERKVVSENEPVRLMEPERKVVPEITEPVIIQANGRKKKMSPPQEKIVLSEEEPGEIPASDASALFEERLRATSNWLAWSYRGGYTIQLMMLTADDAEQNLRDILIQDEYSTVRDDMYIIRRNSPPALFVFYGMFDTLEKARQERNVMPDFLREHNPYALSIKEALHKTEE